VSIHQSLDASQASGNLVHDAHIAALLLEHGVREFWRADRDVLRLPRLRIVNPFREQV
jgi:predicted nucleic acid-binding protein